MKFKSFEEFKEAALAVAPWIDQKVEWTVVGITGGNCWGDDADTPVTTEEEPEDEGLDIVLHEAMPDLTYLEYRKLQRAEIYERGRYTDNQYYGNYYEHDTRKLDLEKLYNALVDIAAARA